MGVQDKFRSRKFSKFFTLSRKTWLKIIIIFIIIIAVIIITIIVIIIVKSYKISKKELVTFPQSI